MGLIITSVPKEKKLVIDLDKKCKLNCDEFKTNLSSSHMNSMFCDLVDRTELSIIIHKMKPNKSSGPDNIGPKLIKEVVEILIEPLVHIFKLTLTTGVVPDKLKIARIRPMFKKGDPQLPSFFLLQTYLIIIIFFLCPPAQSRGREN